MRRTVVVPILVAVFASVPGRAQTGGDDWNTFPPTTPPNTDTGKPAPPPPDPAPKREVPPAPAPTRAATAAAKARVEERLKKASGEVKPAEPATDEAGVVTQQERYLPGTEPHSPSTWGNKYNALANKRVMTGLTSIGLMHVGSADLGPQGVVRVFAGGAYMNQGNFPVRNATNIRTAGVFGASFVPLEFLEAYVLYGASANTNSNSSPNLIQALGDITLGAKASKQWTPGFFAGLDLTLMSFSAVGNQSVDRGALGIAPRLLATYDLRGPVPALPLRLHANLGAVFDGTGGLVRAHKLNAAEEYALGVNRYHRFTLGAGLEAPLPGATPFLEYNLGVPLGVAGGQLIGPDGVNVPVAAAMPQTLGLGLKITAVKDLTLNLGIDFGLSRSVGLGVPATAPYNLHFGAAFAIDPFQRGETKLVETIREKKVETAVAAKPNTGKVAGTVVDAQTRKPIPGVIVAMVGAGLPPVASDADSGRFLTHELPSGPVKLAAHKEGYKEAAQEVVLEPGKTASVELALEAAARNATFLITTAAKKKPVAATAWLRGPAEKQAITADGAQEPLVVEMPAGKYLVEVSAPGFLSQLREVQVTESAKMALDFELLPEPKKKLVVVKENKIEILQQVHFATNRATILADSYNLLAQVVDAIVKSGIKRIRIEGHTDNRGNKERNLKLSQDRANAVADHLAAQGIDRTRMEAVGHGDARPVAPNLTARGRELNRRVDFVILER